MKRNLTIAGALALLATGAWALTGPLVMFSVFGVDFGRNILTGGEALRTPDGGWSFVYDAGDGLVGMWQQHPPSVYGATPGRVWAGDNITPYDYVAGTDTPDTALTITTLVQFTSMRLVVQVEGYDASGPLTLNMWQSRPDSIATLGVLPTPDVETKYTAVVWWVNEDDTVEMLSESVWWNNGPCSLDFGPGRYAMYFAAYDAMGFRTQWLGPVVVDNRGRV